jgi:FkbM family methyltransferase
MKLAIIDIIGIPYDGTTVFKQGLGGSESAVTLMAKELQALKFNVTVFNNCNTDHAKPGIYDGVTYLPLSDLAKDYYFDIVISSRTVIPFTDPNDYLRLNDWRSEPFRNMNLYDRILKPAKMRILWMHDTFCLGDNILEELVVQDRITDVFTLSDWHTTYITNCDHGNRRNYEVLKRKIFVTRNGANSYIPEVDIKQKDHDLFVYNASVTKGMIPLVKHIWPIVKRNIPQAKLKVIGGYYRFSTSSEPDQQEKDWRVMANDPELANLGIEFTGVIPQKEIANILAKASFTIYPAAFPETFGISSLESLLYNTPLITCRFGALEELALENACYVMDYAIEPNSLFQNINAQQQNINFANLVIQAHANKYLHQQKQYYCNIVKDLAHWSTVAIQWKQHLFRRTSNYLSRKEYRQVSKINHRLHKVWGRRNHNTVELETHKMGSEQPIAVISPFYNCQKYIGDCIQSVASQDYENYIHVLIDDASTDDSFNVAARVIKHLPEELQKKFILIKNEVNVGAVCNQVHWIRKVSSDDAIIMLLDGDDTLVNDNTIFSFYNTVYSDNTVEFTYGSCWSMVDNIPLIAQPYPEEVKKSRNYRNYHFNWILPYTHLRTFKKSLINDIDDKMFKDVNDLWYRAGGDGSVFYALIEVADPAKVVCIPDIVYNYNDINPLNDYKVNGDEQNMNAKSIIGKLIPKKYSVVVPTMWKVENQFVSFLAQLCDCDSVGEVLLINNAPESTPETGLDHPKIKQFTFGKNIYVNPAWNIGVENSRYDRVCIVNDDVSFDLKLFDVLKDRLMDDDAGVFGLCPGEPDFDQIPVTDGNIDIVPWAGQHTYGFGCLMFVNKQRWTPIPDGLDIYYGDNFIFDLYLYQGKTNYLIANMNFESDFAQTTSDRTITNGFLERERLIFEQIKNSWNAQSNDDVAIDTGVEDELIVEAVDIFATKKAESIPVASNPQPKPIVQATNKRILIAIPTARNIEVETFKSIYDLEVPEGYTTDFQYFFGYNVDQVRNLIAHWAQHYDYLFAIDSDMGFAKDTLKKFLSHNVDMVSALYIQRIPGTHTLELYEHNGFGGVSNIPYGKIKDRGLVEIAGCGFGCVLIKSEVIRAIPYPQFEYHSALDHKDTISEDTDFCRKALDKGFRIWADTSVKCRHIGSSAYTVDDTILATDAPVLSVEDNLRDLSSKPLLPQAHFDYMNELKYNQNVNPTVIFDIGASVLHWTSVAKRVWPDAQYVVFDAMDKVEFLYKERGLQYNIGVLSDQDGRVVEFYQNDTHPGGNSYYQENVEFSPAAAQLFNESHRKTLVSSTLDTLVKQRGFPAPDFIKMDVQGAELDVLRGAIETLKTVDNIILELQVVEYNKGAPLSDTVIEYMNQNGYELVKQFCNNGPDGDYHFRRVI